MDAFIGMILPFAGGFAPYGWLLCDGRKVPVNQYPALYSILGNRYGGDQTNFALPDLRGRTLVGAGVAATGTNYQLGATVGVETVSLNLNNLPPHSHAASFTGTPSITNITNGTVSGSTQVTVNLPHNATTDPNGTLTNTPADGMSLGVGMSNSRPANIYSSNTADVTVGGKSVTSTGTVTGTVSGQVNVTPVGNVTIGNTGYGVPISVMQPAVVITYIICASGIYPTPE